MAVLAGTKQQKAAEEFIAYMVGPEGKSVFKNMVLLWTSKPADGLATGERGWYE